MSKRFSRSGRGRQCGCRCRSQGEPRPDRLLQEAGEKRWAVGTVSAGCRTPRTQTRIARWCCRRAGAEPTGREPRSARQRSQGRAMRRATAPVRTPSVTFTASAASCRPMPTAAITDFTTPAVRRARLRRHCVGRMHAGSSLSSPTSPPIRGAERTPS